MLNPEKTHPGAEDLLKNNGFSVNRSDVPSSRNALDITIEQTIVTDSYHPRSIKRLERSRRGSSQAHLVKGPSPKVPGDWKKFLCNEENTHTNKEGAKTRGKAERRQRAVRFTPFLDYRLMFGSRRSFSLKYDLIRPPY